jgi:hypothetical protein
LPGGLQFLLQLLRQLLCLLLQVKKLETAVSTVGKISISTVSKLPDFSQNTGNLDKSGIPVSMRSADNAAACAAEGTLDFDKTRVGVIWT